MYYSRVIVKLFGTQTKDNAPKGVWTLWAGWSNECGDFNTDINEIYGDRKRVRHCVDRDEIERNKAK